MPRGTETVVRSRWSPLDTAPGDVAGTHNGLRSHGRCRCLVIRRTLLARLLYRYLPERVKKCHFRWSACNRAVK